MKLGTAFLAATVAAFLGATIWSAVAYFFHIEAGFIAWLVGFLVGLSVFAVLKGRTSRATGVIAAIVAVIGIFGGKFGAAYFLAQDDASAMANQQVTDEVALDLIASEIVSQREDSGIAIDWDSAPDDGYPADIVAEASTQWSALSAYEQEKFKSDLKKHNEESADGAQAALTILYLIFSFGLYDILWLCLAVGTAFRMGSHESGERREAEQSPTVDSAAPMLMGSPLARVSAPPVQTAAATPAAPKPQQASASTQTTSAQNATPPAPNTGAAPGQPAHTPPTGGGFFMGGRSAPAEPPPENLIPMSQRGRAA